MVDFSKKNTSLSARVAINTAEAINIAANQALDAIGADNFENIRHKLLELKDFSSQVSKIRKETEEIPLQERLDSLTPESKIQDNLPTGIRLLALLHQATDKIKLAYKEEVMASSKELHNNSDDAGKLQAAFSALKQVQQDINNMSYSRGSRDYSGTPSA